MEYIYIRDWTKLDKIYRTLGEGRIDVWIKIVRALAHMNMRDYFTE